MGSIATSLLNFKGFKSTVENTNHWFTVGRTIDFTEYVYGKPGPGLIKKTAFNIFKFMRIIFSIRRNIKRLKTLISVIQKTTKIGWKIGKFVFKVTRFLTKLGFKILSWPIKILAKVTFGVVKFVLGKTFKYIVKPIVTLAWNISKKITGGIIKFVTKKIIRPIAEKLYSIAQKIWKIIAPILGAAKDLLAKGFGLVKNLVINDKTRYIFNKGAELFTRVGGSIKSFAGGTIKFFKEGTSTVIGKVIGLGKDAKDLMVVTKDGVKSAGVSAVEWFKKTKRKWKLGLKIIKHKFSLKWYRFKNVNKVGKLMAATFKWGIKLFKGLLKGAKLIMKAISSTIAWLSSAPSAGLSLLLPLVLGLIFESFTYLPKLVGKMGLSWFLTLGKYILSVVGWVVPVVGYAMIAYELANIFGKQLVDFLLYLAGKTKNFLLETIPFKQIGVLDGVFTHDSAQHINNIKDLQNNTFTNEISRAKTFTDMFNNTALEIISLLKDKQAQRSILMRECVVAI